MSSIDEFEKRRNELYEQNSKAWNGDAGLLQAKDKLDTSLKKNTAFIKRIRLGINKESEAQLLEGIQTISLEKYINEISSALCESLCRVSKNADIQCAVEVVSALHQRFTLTFTPYIELFFVHGMAQPSDKLPKKDEKERQVRIKNLLKLAMEFFLCGIFRTMKDMPAAELPPYLSKLKAMNKDDIPIIVPLMKEIMSYDFVSGMSLPGIHSFLKRFGGIIYNENPRYSENSMVFLRKLLKSYINNAVSTTETYHKNIMNKKATAQIVSLKTGKIASNIEDTIEELQGTFEEFKAFCDFACPLADIRLPVLEYNTEKEEESVVTVLQPTPKQNIIWENDEVRKFYEEIPNLDSIVSKEVLDSINAKILPHEMKGSKSADIILRLDNAETAEDVDNTVKDFWEWGLSNKASRNRLSKHIVELRDTTKFRNFARFLKINETYFEKCIEDLIDRLDKSFRFQMHHDAITEKDILLFAELVKFKLIPIHVIFHKVRTLILNIEVNNNIDLLSLMFDACGKVLLNDEDYKDYTKGLIQLLVQVYKTRKFSHTDKYAVKVFLLSLNPPKLKEQNIVNLSKEERFLSYIIKTQLSEKTYELVAKRFKSADWDNPIIYQAIIQILSKPSNISFINIKYLAEILRILCVPYSYSLKTQVIDQVIEDITVGLEQNDLQQARTRLSEVIYFAYIINLKIISEDYLVAILYKIVCFGHPGSNPTRNFGCELDMPNDHFRIRLISSMLLALDIKKLKSETITNLEVFYKFFNHYVFTKVEPLAIDLSSKLDDTWSHLNPYFSSDSNQRPASYEESLKILQNAFSKPDVNLSVNNKSREETNDAKTDDKNHRGIGMENSSVATAEDDESDDGDIYEYNDDDDDDDDDDDEEDEDDDEEDEDDEDDDDDDASDSNYDSDSDESDDSDDSDGETDSDESDDNSEEEEGNIEIVADLIDDAEEDEEDDITSREKAFFDAELDIEFEKMMNESLANAAAAKPNKGFLSDSMGTPEAIMYKLKKANMEDTTAATTTTSSSENIHDRCQDKDGSVRFTFLSRSGKKVQQKNISVPDSSNLAINVTREQERIRSEKDKIKSFVLKSVNR